MSHFSAVHRRTSISAGLSLVYDNRFGTDTTTAAATGWFTFALHSGNRRVWVDGSKADDTGTGLSAASAKKTLDAAFAVFINGSWTSGDQLMIAGGSTYSTSVNYNNGAGGLCNIPGISAAYPTAILCYDSADPTNSAKYGKLLGSARPTIHLSGNMFNNVGDGDANYAIQGLIFDNQNADGANGPLIQQKHDNVAWQNCLFPYSELTTNRGGSYDATATTYNQNGNISKCGFYGPWGSSGNTAGLYIHATKDYIIEDNVFAHCGWHIGSSRDDGNSGGAFGTNHSHYISATNTGMIVRRNFYIDSSYDDLNVRCGGTISSIASLDAPAAGSIGAFSSDYRLEAPNGIPLALDDWVIMGGAPLNAGTPAGFGPLTTNTLAGSYMRNIAAFDNPTHKYFFGLDNPNTTVPTSITHSGTTATVTVAGHGYNTGDRISIYGAAPSAYNVVNTTVTVVDANTFTYPMATTPATNATSVGQYTGLVPIFLTIDKVHSYDYSSSFSDTPGIGRTDTFTNIISDQLASGTGNSTSTSGTFSGYKTRDQVITAVLNGVGITPGATYYARKAQIVNAALARPDLPWPQWIIGVGFTAMNLTPAYSTPAYQTFTDTPVTAYPTALADLTISTLNFTHGVNSSARLSGLCANPVLTCSDLPAGLTLTGSLISGSATSAGTPTIHIVETSQDDSIALAHPHTTAFTLNIS